MRIVVTSVLVDDQDKALRFYTDVLGFVKKTEVPLGAHRWLTVVSPDDPDGVELVLEPDEHPAIKPFKRALVEDGIPFTSVGVEDIHAEYNRLRSAGGKASGRVIVIGPYLRLRRGEADAQTDFSVRDSEARLEEAAGLARASDRLHVGVSKYSHAVTPF